MPSSVPAGITLTRTRDLHREEHRWKYEIYAPFRGRLSNEKKKKERGGRKEKKIALAPVLEALQFDPYKFILSVLFVRCS